MNTITRLNKLINSVDLSPSWEAANRPTTQEIRNIL
jgi:hypothetical protein